MAIEFTDNSIKVKNLMEESAIAFLHEVGLTMQRAAANNCKIGHETAQKWDYAVDEKNLICTIGNPDMKAVWDEYGTGEHALNGDGRKGWWVYVEGNDIPNAVQHRYTQKEAKEVCAFLRSQGLPAHYTNGRAPTRGLHNAYIAKKPAIINRAKQIMGAKFDT